jgi:hypothetical protein
VCERETRRFVSKMMGVEFGCKFVKNAHSELKEYDA